ncbi:MAG TPA: pyridoxal-dependent decarboxylase [Thermoanaerobaculia bacterium]|nr:pyridoxal-dependent decarboxylase [Thermoanaerobaculia bacterium]
MPGDVPGAEFRAAMHRTADMIADYLEGIERYPVVPPIQPGDVARSLPEAPPEHPEPLDRLLDDFSALIEPNVTHWNHPGFLAYFAITGSGPGILGEALAAGLNVNAMLWRTGPAPTELEERTCDWLRQMMDLPPVFRGHINDTASISSLLALAVARHRAPGLDVRSKGLSGRDLPALTVYASDQAHSSIDKAAMLLGLGAENVRRVESDPKTFRMSVPALERAIAADRAAGKLPIAVVSTSGSTSTTSLDPTREIAAVCRRESLWLHVDAAYGGPAAICPELRPLFDGMDEADSIVVNPHKWLFVPVDCSILYVRDPALLKDAFSLVPEYLKTGDAGATNLMDLGIQLGRRFRSLKLWMVIRAFGVEGLRERIRAHCALATRLAERVAVDPRFELAAPAPLSAVCLRLRAAEGQDEKTANERLLAAINAEGPFFLSHTVLNGRYAIRVAIGNIRTGERHLDALWQAFSRHGDAIRSGEGG